MVPGARVGPRGFAAHFSLPGRSARERDAIGLVEALRGRGVEVNGLRARSALLAPVASGSLERTSQLNARRREIARILTIAHERELAS